MYEHDDAYLADLLAKVDANTVVIVVSDHGFKASGRLPGLTKTINYHSVGIDKTETSRIRSTSANRAFTTSTASSSRAAVRS